MPTASAAVSSSSIKCTDAPATLVLLAERRSAGSWWDSAGRTIVQSASEAEDLIGHQRGGFHLENIVDADHVRTAQDGGGDGGGGSALQKARRRVFELRQKRFSRRAHHQWKIERRERVQVRQDLGVLLFALAEAEAGIDGNPRPIHARPHRAMRGGVQILP